MTFKEYMSNRLISIEDKLNSSFKIPEHKVENQFIDILKYPILAGGKRFRPILTLLTAEMFGFDYKKALNPACSIELIHTYSLVHDDLPAMDNDDLRRGMPTCHVKYGYANAILAGDALLTHAFAVLADTDVDGNIIRRLFKEISFASGGYGMVMGQYLDLAFENSGIDFEMLKNLHAKKTGALIRASVRCGGIVAGIDESDLENINIYGDSIGLAFQIQDDILDKISDSQTLGKTVGKDESADKLTYVKQFGIDGAQKKATEAIEKAIEAISHYDDNEYRSHLIEIAKYIVERKS